MLRAYHVLVSALSDQKGACSGCHNSSLPCSREAPALSMRKFLLLPAGTGASTRGRQHARLKLAIILVPILAILDLLDLLDLPATQAP